MVVITIWCSGGGGGGGGGGAFPPEFVFRICAISPGASISLFFGMLLGGGGLVPVDRPSGLGGGGAPPAEERLINIFRPFPDGVVVALSPRGGGGGAFLT